MSLHWHILQDHVASFVSERLAIDAPLAYHTATVFACEVIHGENLRESRSLRHIVAVATFSGNGAAPF